MNLIVIGCGRVGAELSIRLFQNGHTVTVVDQSEKAFHNLPMEFRGRTVVGDGLNQDTLIRAGIEDATGLAAVTSKDTVNAVVAHLAREVYQVPTVVVRNFNSRFRPMLEAFGLQLVSSSSWGAQRIEEMLYHTEARAVFSAGNGEVELYEFIIPEDWQGSTIKSLIPEKGCVVSALTRAGRAMLPEPDFIFSAGDVLLVSATLEGSQVLRRRIKSPASP